MFTPSTFIAEVALYQFPAAGGRMMTRCVSGFRGPEHFGQWVAEKLAEGREVLAMHNRGFGSFTAARFQAVGERIALDAQAWAEALHGG